VRSMLVSFWFVLFRLWRTCTGAAALDTFSVALFVVASHAAAHEDPLAARIENMEQGRRKKKKKAGCMSFLSPRVGKRKEKKQDPQGPVDIGAGLTVRHVSVRIHASFVYQCMHINLVKARGSLLLRLPAWSALNKLLSSA